MSSSPFNTPLALKINSSFLKWLIVLTPHFLVLTVVLTLDVFNLSIRFLLIIFVFLSSVYYICLYLQKCLSKSVSMIYQDSAKNWFIKTNNHDKEQVFLSGSSFVSNILILINFIDINNKKYHVLITSDSLSKAKFRRLIVRIKLGDQV